MISKTTTLFIYGTLLDEDVSSRVIMETFRIIPATLDGYLAVYVSGQSYPGITRNHTATTSGGVIKNLSEKALSRLEFFEGSEYSLINVDVRVGPRVEQAFVFAPGADVSLSETPWDLAIWRRKHKPMFMKKFF
ncbi:MAG: gamma-glutamylcyclotransferase [Rhodospirillaceae bacterium]|nr:gamma-glutamylcyclotransferase [Rhodospirillaceae bacterium]